MEVLEDRKLCTGCSACGQVCPQHAIEMTANDEGFLYPEIDVKLCNDCRLCQRTCPVSKAVNTGAESQDAGLPFEGHKAYACYSNDEQIRSKSSSGGIFTQLAQSIISRNGIVFGAEFDEAFKVRHNYVESTDGLDALRRSKYVQSDTQSTFIQAKEFLNAGRPVLYCGTPCQAAGLRAFLNKEYDNLLICELACHGVPSPLIWKMYLDYISGRYQSPIVSVSFRDKSTGWNDSSMKINFEDGRQYKERVKKEIFFIGFGKSIFNRSTCYSCKFRINNTKADITLADFWGIDRQGDSDFTDNKGVSLVITHTEAGDKALSQILDSINMKQRPLDVAARYNPRLVSSVLEPAGRKSFFEDLKAGYSFDLLRKKYMDNFSIKYRIKSFIREKLL